MGQYLTCPLTRIVGHSRGFDQTALAPMIQAKGYFESAVPSCRDPSLQRSEVRSIESNCGELFS
jgi:hypothetical protein